MTKKDIMKEMVLSLIKENPGISSVQIGDALNRSRIAAFIYIKSLFEEGLIEKRGNRSSTRYFYKKNETFPFDIKKIGTDIKELLKNDYSMKGVDIEKEVANLIYVIMPDGDSKVGYQGLFEMVKKERSGKDPSYVQFLQAVAYLLSSYWELKLLRNRNGFFDGTESLHNIMKQYSDTAVTIDKLYFAELSQAGRFRLRIASVLSLGKLKSNKALLIEAISVAIERIKNFLEKEKPDAIILTPPTIKREFQFRDVLLDELIKSMNYVFPLVEVEKIEQIGKEFQPQKGLKGYERIINAEASVVIKDSPDKISSLKKVVIFDDNFTTGATMNAIGSKLRSQGFKGKLIAMAITGFFSYEPGVTDIGDV